MSEETKQANRIQTSILNPLEKKVLVMKPSLLRTWYLNRVRVAAFLFILMTAGPFLFILTRNRLSAIVLRKQQGSLVR